MIEDAIRRINEEMQRHPSDRMLEAVGQYLIDICTTEDTAKALLDEKKTLAGAISAMREAARKKQHGGYYAMAPDEAWEIVRKYYGLAAADAPHPPPAAAPSSEGEGKEDAEKISIDFDSFWG